jgi:hypothetical protein
MSATIKFIATLILSAAVLLAAGLSGLTFYMWPTHFGDHALVVNSQILAELSTLQAERKFVEDKKHFYFGAPNEEARATAQNAVDALIAKLLRELPSNPKRSIALAHFKLALSSFDTPESEERDQFLVYLQRISLIVGIHDSGELFNVWRYGFPYGWIPGN